MKESLPQFRLARVTDAGTEDVRIVRISEIPLDTRSDRRGFLGTAMTASAAVGAILAGCRPPRSPSSGAQCSTLAHRGAVTALAVGNSGRLLVSAGLDDAIKLWTLPDGALTKSAEAHHGGIRSIAIAPDGKSLASAGDDGNIALWTLPEVALSKSLQGNGVKVASVTITPDGTLLVSAGNLIELWSLPDGVLTKTLDPHAGTTSVAVSPDGRLLASGGRDHLVRLWSLPDGAFLRSLAGHEDEVHHVAVSADGRLLVSAGADRTVKLWRLPDGVLLRSLTGHDSAVQAVAIAPNGRLIASASADHTVKLWSLPDCNLVKSLDGHGQLVHSVAVTPDSRVLASASKDQTIMLWLLPEGTPYRCFLDLDASPKDVTGITYTARDEYGRELSYTLPCGSPLPPGVTCTCNCVPGSYAPPAPPESNAPSTTYVPSGTYCSCDMVCTCLAVPVCQAHKLLDPDPVVRAMAEQIVLFMGPREIDYLAWAAAESRGALRRRITRMQREIEAGRRAEPSRWPDPTSCVRYLDDPDPVVRILSAQTLHLGSSKIPERSALRSKIDAALREAARRHWRKRVGR